MRALLSVYNKSGIVQLAQDLHRLGVELVSTGGTHRALAEAGLPVRQVADLTGFPEILDGRVKTLHPAVHGGLLARRDRPQHLRELERHGIAPVDVVVVNLYPFVESAARGLPLDEVLEQIDIGGPTLLRAAAKNYPFVLVVVDPADYGWVAERLAGGGVGPEERRALAAKAFRHVATYDAAIAQYLGQGLEETPLPEELPLGYRKALNLRYGENPHQQGALYAPALGATALARAVHLHGRVLSFNNLLDADAAWRVVQEFAEPAVVVIKHTNPCGLAVHPDLAEAYRRAHAGDPVSAYGGIVGFNRAVTAEAARATEGVFYEVVVAPGYEPEALEALRRRRNLRVLQVPGDAAPSLDLRPISGGLLVQTPDTLQEDPAGWKTVTERAPTPEELRDLAFAWKAVKHVKSNAIVLAREGALVGLGAGQPNRVTSVFLAARVAGERARGSVMASDAFFPFPDSVEAAAEAGVTAVAQPGGSIRDKEVIEAANRLNLAMVFTGVRHFRH